MAGETRVIAFGSGGQQAVDEEIEVRAAETIAEPQDFTEEEPFEDVPPGPSRGWLLPMIACLAVIGWSAAFGWFMREEIAVAARPAEWIGLIRDWAVLVLLIGLGALLALRNSRREALRFGDAARVLSEESARLETRLTTINRELSLAREFLASQSRDLEALGRLAIDRLSKESDRLQSLVSENHDRVDAIGRVSEAALDNMEKLRGQLPVIASSAKDVTNNIGTAGRTAHAQLQDMVHGFNRLNEFGMASERQVQSLRSLVDTAIAEFGHQAEQLDAIAVERFAAMAERSAEFRAQLDQHEIAALAAIRSRSTTMAQELEQTRGQLDAHEAESLTSLRARLSSLRDEGAAITRSLRESEARALEAWENAAAATQERLREALAQVAAADAEGRDTMRARLEEIAGELTRFDADLAERARSFDAVVAQREAAMQEHTARGLAAFNNHLAEIDAALAACDARIAALNDAAVARLAEQLAAADAEIETRRLRHERQGAAIAAHGETIVARLGDAEQRLAEIAAHGSEAGSALSESLTALSERLAASRSALAGTNGEIAELTDGAVRLLELIQASAQHSRDELPRALAAGEGHLAELERRVAALGTAVDSSRAGGEVLAGHVDATGMALRALLGEVETLQSRLTAGSAEYGETIAALRASLDAIEAQNERLATQARGELSGALAELTEAARRAVEEITAGGEAAVSSLAQQLGHESGAAIERAMRNSSAEVAGQLEQAAAHAAGVSREAAIQLRDQLTKVDELAGNLERRVAHARQRAEEQVDSDFTRRVALITESLNSNAIDIAKALSTDVSDTAWTAYLKGNRGIFTRRAVSLIESAEAKAIAQIYERDRDFHEHVSRYIHDFEAMMRQVLSARDGNALGVTLLSSDMGKLYVALAQAIQRLRD